MKYGDLKELWPALQPVGNTTQETWRAPEKMEVKKKKIQEITGSFLPQMTM